VEYTNIKLEKENRVATIRLNRPDALKPGVDHRTIGGHRRGRGR